MIQATTRQYDEFVLRRLTEPFPLVGSYLDPRGNTILWLAVLIAILLVGVIYVGIMYLRDSRGVGVLWAGFLGLLRLGVYATIAFIFLLPSKQTYEESSASSRVLVLFDVSDSMGTRDDIPKPGERYDKLLTRGQKLQNFLEDSRIDFFGRVTKTNPAGVYRMAVGLDNNSIYFDAEGRAYTKEEYAALEEKRKQQPQNFQPDAEKHPFGHEYLTHFFNPVTDTNAKPVELPGDMNPYEKDRVEKLLAHNRKLASAKFFSGTNLGDATLNLMRREKLDNMVQGIVIFTDGRSTEGSEAAFEQIDKLAKSANVPIFVVGIGAVRPQVRIDIDDFRAPTQVQPEDKFRVVATIIGEGLAEKEIAPELHITYTKKQDDGTVKKLKMFLAEQDDTSKNKTPKPQSERTHIELNEEIVLKPENPVKFDTSSPPRAEVEFVIDAASLAKANNPSIDLTTDPDKRGRKWELGETGEGDMHFQLFVPKDNLELFADAHHKSDLLDLKVIKKPLRVLLFASAATHDFQFLNNMMLREVMQQRADLAVYVQPPPGKQPEEWFKSVVLGVKPDRLLLHFPDKYDAKDLDPKDEIYDLNNYDVIVAFDPDWSKLDPEQIKLVKTWCDKGGGLVMVGGPINTLQLARPGENHERLQPLLDIMPVVLADVRIGGLDRTTTDPWPLHWSDAANDELEFLKLTEDSDTEHTNFKEGWNEFFYSNKKGEGQIKRGFYNYYPTELVKSGSLVIARFGDPRGKMKDGEEMPWIVLNAAGSPERVVWIAWGDTRRLRQYSESFYERFWIKMLRYAGAKNQTNLARRIRLDMGKSYTAGRFIQLEAKIDDRGGEPLNPRADHMPKIHLKLPAGVNADEIKTDFPLDRKPARDPSDKGKFTARFQVKSPGDYQLELTVPDTGDSIIQKFNVKESNPELDNTRPDFDLMYHLASDADPVLARIPLEADRQEVKKALTPPKMEAKAGKDDAAKEGKARLYFTLENARLIPSCMVTKTDTKQIRGKYQDMWDFGLRKDDHNPLYFIFNMLALIVGLLSVEWLIRKLLRLA